MKRYLKSLSVAATVLAMAACAGNNKNYTELISHEWILDQVEHADSVNKIVVPQNLTIQFSDSARLVGRGPCNVFFGPYSVEEQDIIDFGDLASTMAYCPDMPFETNYFKWLNEVDKYKVSGKMLILSDEGNKIVLHYKIKEK